MYKTVVTIFSFGIIACTNSTDLSEKEQLKMKHITDSLHRADSIIKYRQLNENMLLSKQDSIQHDSVINARYAAFDSIREADSIKYKRKKREMPQPAPKKMLKKTLVPKN